MLWVLFLLLAWTAAALGCARLCATAVSVARPLPTAGQPRRELTLYEAAFLAGGPTRVTDLTLVLMDRRRRLLLAHTGWTTLVDPRGHNELERSVIAAIGPSGQAPTRTVRAAASATDAVDALGDRLAGAGLAVPAPARTRLATALRGVRAAAVLAGVLLAVAPLLPRDQVPAAAHPAWLALPLLLTLATLAVARLELRPYTRWASPAGERLLARFSPTPDGSERGYLTAVAVLGVTAVDDPRVRAALG
ncbi:TIGR04222 domain-containing membrane protein [Streptomyces sp. NPDC057638]|uniref:TIGR04222 domain-containing membrane protein n=1 Tax=Streptomyces sp. NPDC057638 TaxID=3346190 RepID=UPI0036B8CAE8